MGQLVIEYALDSLHPGYRFKPPADGFDEQTLKTIWRWAMPRGQGWGAEIYTGARSLKCFPIDARSVAVSVVTVTDQEDEMGRRGIRRAEVTVMPPDEYGRFLESTLRAFPAPIRDAAARRVSAVVWKRLINKVVPRLKDGKQVVLAHPYRDPEAWQVIEVLVLRLVTSHTIRMIEGWGRVTPFTTLALDWREEAGIVALPLEKARERQGGAPTIVIP